MGNIEVSIICQVFNHASYLRKCLDSLVSQKTNFPYEIIVHDDKSTDNSAGIIEEYVNKYGSLFTAIYEKENQYSKGKMIIRDIMLPKAKGRFLAFCEGDDYWCDENKLQKQYDYMTSDLECVMCAHNTIRHFLNGSRPDELFNHWTANHVLTAADVFGAGKVHTSSKMIYKDVFEVPEFATKYWFGDLVNLTWTFQKGKIVSLPDVMSVYNSGVSGGATDIAFNSDVVTIGYKQDQLLQYFNEYNKATNYKYDNYISPIILQKQYAGKIVIIDRMYARCRTRHEFVECGRKVRKDRDYREMIKSSFRSNPIMTLKIIIKFRFPYIWYLLKMVINYDR